MTDDYQDETGEEIVRALKSAGAEAVRKALIGCLFYRDDPDDATRSPPCPPRSVCSFFRTTTMNVDCPKL
jgi:hypothetical protein